jgi:hypothetical protein
MLFILTLIANIILDIIEAKLETFVIDLKDPSLPNYNELNTKEHKWSAIYVVSYALILTTIMIFFGGWTWLLLFPTLILARRLFFQESLNLMRGKGLGYMSDRGIDGWMKKKFGEHAGAVNGLICLMGITIFMILQNIL